MVAFDVCPALLIIFEELSRSNHDVAEPVNVGNRSVELISSVGYSPPLAESTRRSSPIFWIFLFGLVALLFVLFWYFTRSKHKDDHAGDHSSDVTSADTIAVSTESAAETPVTVPIVAKSAAAPEIDSEADTEVETATEVEETDEVVKIDGVGEESKQVPWLSEQEKSSRLTR